MKQVSYSGKYSFSTSGAHQSDLKTQGHWPIALSLSFKFMGRYSAFQHHYREPQPRSVSPFFIGSDLSQQSPRFASLSFPTLEICIECVPKFRFLYHISCMKGVFALLILCSIYRRLVCPVKL